MPLLAEPRKREKWTLNPRGADWANDDNKFGQKLMEKMGWSKGKGLGRNEQGMKNHISLRLKSNRNGFGFKGNDDEWVRHYEGFEDVLATLNSEHNSTANSKNGSSCNSSANSDEDTDQKNKSLEARSKVSKARVHYHKFTRGKDVSRYNKDDIACILGSKRAKKLAEADAEVSTTKIDEIGHVTNMNDVTTIKGCSIQDYFKQKMAALKGSTLPELQKAENREEGKKELLKPGFGSSLDISCSNVSLINGEAEEKKLEKDDTEERSSKFTKKRKNKYALKGEDEEKSKANQDTEVQKKEEEMEEHLLFKLKVEENLSYETKESVKRKTTDGDARTEYPLSRNPFVEFETNERESKKKKKKKKKREETLEDELVELNKVENKSPCTKETIEETVIEIEHSANMKQNKTKKRNRNWEEDILQKSKGEGAFENNRKDKNKMKYKEMVDSSFFEAQNNQQSLKSSKKKKFEQTQIEDQTPQQDTEWMNDVNETIVEDIKKYANTDENKAKKKKKKCKGEDGSYENELKEISESNMKHKKKQKAENDVLDTSIFVKAQNIQESVKSNKKRKFREDKDAMQDGLVAVETVKKADHEKVLYAPQFDEMENFHESLKIKIKENTSKLKHSDLGYEKQTTKQDTEAIPNAEENADFHGEQGEKKRKKKKSNHVGETNKQGIYDSSFIGLSFDSQQLKRKKTKDKGSCHNEKHFEEVNRVICDVSDKCPKISDEAKNDEYSENPDAQLDKTGSIMNDSKKRKVCVAIDSKDFSKPTTVVREIESIKIQAKRQTKIIENILSKMNIPNKTLREKPSCFSESLGSPENCKRLSFQGPRINEIASLDDVDMNMEDVKNRDALETADLTSNKFSKKGTAVQNTSLGSEQFSKNEICEKSIPRVLDEFVGNRTNVSDGNKRLYCSYAERSVRGTWPNISHDMNSSYMDVGKFKTKQNNKTNGNFRSKQEIYSGAMGFRGANIWECKGYPLW